MQDVNDITRDELGVALDEAVDTAVEARHAAHSLQEMYVTLDHHADTHEFPPHAVETLRGIQSDVEEAMNNFADLADDMDDRIERIRAELGRQ